MVPVARVEVDLARQTFAPVICAGVEIRLIETFAVMLNVPHPFASVVIDGMFGGGPDDGGVTLVGTA